MKTGINDLIAAIKLLAQDMDEISIMEVCGTHTASIRKYGIPSVLPENIRLVSGPGCPVCVTSQEDINIAVSIADREDVIFTCFGDMMRVPCGDRSLYSLREAGRDIRIITSPMEVLDISKANPEKQVVYLGIGFETTAPHTAVLVEEALKQNIKNISVLNSHKTMPQAITQLLKDECRIDALLCPGHVAAIIGSDAFNFVPESLNLPAVISGFEAYEILAAILSILTMLKNNRKECINMYPMVVTKSGNKKALELINRVMESEDAVWRGLGIIPKSGLKFRESYIAFDASKRFEIIGNKVQEPKGCLCSGILRGESIPTDCRHFGKNCIPDKPMGPCMVSSEGSCFSYYNYREI